MFNGCDSSLCEAKQWRASSQQGSKQGGKHYDMSNQQQEREINTSKSEVNWKIKSL